MTKEQFKNVKIGDICEFNKVSSKDYKRRGKIVYINDGGSILIESLDGNAFKTYDGTSRNVRLCNWRNVNLIEES